MPYKSEAQRRLMQGIAHGMKPYSKDAPTQEQAQSFVKHSEGEKAKSLVKALRKPR